MYCRTKKASIPAIGLICNNVPVTGTSKKENETMLTIYEEILDILKNRYPKNTNVYFQEFIREKLSFYKQFPSLAMIEILELLYQYRNDKNDRNCLSDIYEKYSQTGFMVAKLKQEDFDYIWMRYLQELMKMLKEEDDAI